MKVIYAGPDNYRQLSSADLRRDSRVDKASSMTFERGVAKEVSDEVGQALLENSTLFGRFVEDETSKRELAQVEAEAQEVEVKGDPGVEPADAPIGRGSRTTGRS